MEPWHLDDRATIYHGDCIEVLRQLPDCSVDSVVTDPPYGLEFMGKEWDKFGRDTGNHKHAEKPRFTSDHMGKGFDKIPNTFEAGLPFQRWCELWVAECLRVLKPGGHLLAFGGTRTWHRLAVAVEDAGFEVRDSIAWLYGSGFPKSLDVSKAIDKAAGAKREVIHSFPRKGRSGGILGAEVEITREVTVPGSDDALTWQGWGTALKPAFEPIVVARKPLTGTVAANVLEHGTGGLNIDGCRIGSESRTFDSKGIRPGSGNYIGDDWQPERSSVTVAGRWPANVVLDEDQADALDRQSGWSKSPPVGSVCKSGTGQQPLKAATATRPNGHGDSGGASRFFYVAKAPARERPKVDGVAHPTVKPLTLMRWLCRLVTPPGGTVLEPFAGSGTTIEAALLEGFRVVAVEREDDYLPLIAARLERIGQEPDGQLTLDASA